jgi:hypothetical protein
MPEKKKPPVLTTKERVQKMLSVRKTEDEIIDTYKRFRERFKDILDISKEPKKVETPRKLTKAEWVEQQIDLIPKNADKYKVLNTLKKGDKVSLSYNNEENFITGVVATNPIVRIRLAEGIEPAVKINIKTVDGGKPKEYQLKTWRKGLSMDLIDKIAVY